VQLAALWLLHAALGTTVQHQVQKCCAQLALIVSVEVVLLRHVMLVHMAQALVPLLAHCVVQELLVPSLELQLCPNAASVLWVLLLLHQE
jgi:hypothetical protein